MYQKVPCFCFIDSGKLNLNY